jgi:hypothetical protein
METQLKKGLFKEISLMSNYFCVKYGVIQMCHGFGCIDLYQEGGYLVSLLFVTK